MSFRKKGRKAVSLTVTGFSWWLEMCKKDLAGGVSNVKNQ